MLSNIRSDIGKATSITELFQVFDKHTLNTTPDTKGANARKKANQLAIDILERVKGDYSQITDEEREQLRQYTGVGGIGGSINEYYTPKWVASAVWDSLKAYGFNGGRTLEPSAGIGVFSETKPNSALVTSVEMDSTSSAINQILHPDDQVINSAFEAVATDPEIGDFDAVIGNPPYGDRDRNISKDKQYSSLKRAELYFIERSIDKARAGGLIALVLPTGVVDKKSLKKWRTGLSLKAEFLGAHRLPSGIFNDTNVTTDLVIWRKHSDELAELAKSADLEALKNAAVLWDTWIDGLWFKKEGKRFIQGEQFVQGKGKFARTVVDRGNRTNQQIAKALSIKFDSRINWEALDHVEPVSEKYGEGDTTYHNGQQMIMRDGLWQKVRPSEAGGQIEAAKFGVENIGDIAAATSSAKGIEGLTAAQVINLHEQYAYKCDNSFNTLARNLNELPPASRDKALKGILLGKRVRILQDMVSRGAELDASDVDLFRKSLAADITQHFATNGNRNPTGFNKLDAKLAAEFSAYQASISKDGKLSDLMKGDLTKEEINQYDTTKINDVMAYARNELGRTSLTIDELREIYKGHEGLSDSALLNELALHEEVAVNNDGSISDIHQAISGNVTDNIARLNRTLAITESEAVRDNIERQLSLIDAKRNKIELGKVHMKLTDKWIPKKYMLEFLHEQGFDEFEFGQYTMNENGTVIDFDESEDGEHLSGYRWRYGKKRSASAKDAFEFQVESYVNFGKVEGGSGNAGRAVVRERIRQLDKDFTSWIASSQYADELEAEYNQRFANWIEPKHDDSDLNLNAVSGSIKMMKYQNEAIRKHSDDGCGILAFGTGLGKTLTALALGEYNLQTGRASRIAYVVPKSVIENWFYESDLFFGEKNMSNKVFIGVDAEKGEGGEFIREPLLDEEGNQKLDASGKAIMRPKLKVDTSTKKIAPQLHELAQSKARIVVMTKDVYNRLPMRDSTISEHVDGMIEADLVAGKNEYVKRANNYREAQRNARFEATYADEGTEKKEELPFYEDLLFDNVIIDEGHDFRNSYKGGSYGNKLDYLPNAAQADRALDMQIKNNFLKARNDGKGVYMLTATPTVNSPVDAFNMLSHIMPPDAFARMGIVNSDDFIRLFGRTGETAVTRLSGKVETREALLGFQNLEALRSIFNRHVTIKDMKDVSSDVHIPELVAATSYVDMSEEQAEIYEQLRQRADALSNPDDPDNAEILEAYPDDTIFGLIRKMDKACTDLDLYRGVVTYRFAKSKLKAVEAVLDKLPKTVKVKMPKVDDTGEIEISEKTGKEVLETVDVEIKREAKIIGKHCEVVLSQELDGLFGGLCAKDGLKFTHPVSPKYAKFLENAKTVYLAGGKQLVFTEEKTQHVKLARIIADYVGCKLTEIGILNSDTVAGKKGSKADDDDMEAGLESLANAYNTGRYKFMVLNKKGEVGINLHHGTTDIHHLTLPWTPSSITQRNGRGARVGSKAKKVNTHYYAGKGSFDEFRIETIERKAKWINDLFTGDESYVENGNADDGSETTIMLARDPEKQKALREENRKANERALKVEQQRQASISVSRYIAASRVANVDVESLKSKLAEMPARIEAEQVTVSQLFDKAQGQTRNQPDAIAYRTAADDLQSLKNEQRKLSRQIEEAETGRQVMKRLKSSIGQAVDNGVLAGYEDIFTNTENYMTNGVQLIRKGFTYHAKVGEYSFSKDFTVEALVTVQNFDANAGTVSGLKREVYDDGTVSSSVGSISNLPMKQCYRLADVDHSAEEIKAFVGAPHSLADVASKVSREDYLELWRNGFVRAYGSQYAKPFVIDSDGRYRVSYTDNDAKAQHIVYPDAKDKATAKAILKQVSNDIAQTGSASIPEEILNFFIGRDWKDQAIEAGNKASEADIAKAVQAVIKNVEAHETDDLDDALRKLEVRSFFGGHPIVVTVKSDVAEIDWKGYTNRKEIATIQSRLVNEYSAELIQRSVAYRQAAKDKAFAAYRDLVSSDPTRTERLEAIAKIMQGSPAPQLFRVEIKSIYGEDKDAANIVIRADLAVKGFGEQTNGDAMAALDNEYDSSIWAWNDVYISNKQAFIESVLKLEEEVKPSPVTEKQQAKTDAINATNAQGFSDLVNACKKFDIIVKEVTQDLAWVGKSRNRVFNNKIAAYTKIALQTPDTTGGILKSTLGGNNALKKELGAKYGTNCGDGFVGSWWFIDSDADLSILVSALADNA